MASGLYKRLISENLLISHKDVTLPAHKKTADAWKIIQPQMIPFISYAYEWSFGMLKDAALLTLNLQKIAIEHGMSLKDASVFNVQFLNGKPILIDSLSFEKHDEGKPWIAYKQFVEHFLSPLLLMAKVDIRLNRLLSVFLDGIPVEIAAKMLPFSSRLNLSLLIHIFAHAKSQKKFSTKKLGKTLNTKRVSKRAMLGIVDNLENTIKKLTWKPIGTQWEDYYKEDKNNYNDASFTHKASIIKSFLSLTKPATVWDMGANTGYFSNIAAEQGANVIAFDIDYGAIEKNYQDVKNKNQTNMLPLFSDITNPTPAVGWENEERQSLLSRGPADTVLALALIHHLAISNNMPFINQASLFAKLGKYVIIEYINKDDSQVQILLANRKDIFDKYSQKDFEEAFSKYFIIKKTTPVKDSKRILYLMERKK